MIARSWEFLLNFSFAMRCLEIVEIFGARFEAKRNCIIGPQSSEVVMHFRLQVFLSHESHEGRVLKARFMADAADMVSRIWPSARSNSPMSWMLHPKP